MLQNCGHCFILWMTGAYLTASQEYCLCRNAVSYQLRGSVPETGH